MKENKGMHKKEVNKIANTKKVYQKPELRTYGDVRELTKNTIASSGEGQSGMGMV